MPRCSWSRRAVPPAAPERSPGAARPAIMVRWAALRVRMNAGARAVAASSRRRGPGRPAGVVVSRDRSRRPPRTAGTRGRVSSTPVRRDPAHTGPPRKLARVNDAAVSRATRSEVGLSEPAGRPTIGVLALQGDVREHVGVLDLCGADPVLVRRPAELAAVDALVLPGGESTTISKLLQVFELLEPLRARLRDGMPAFGSCAGMILLAGEVLDARPDAQHLSGIDMTVRRNAFGRQVDSFETDLDFAGVDGGPMRAVFIRAPWVERAGAGVEVLARVPSGPAAGRIVAVRQGNVLATSFHPEVTGDHRVHRLFVDLVRDR